MGWAETLKEKMKLRKWKRGKKVWRKREKGGWPNKYLTTEDRDNRAR